ncbi:MAG: ThiF family adenylyltransferase, partial [Oscillospiraceae bacterium]
MNDTTNWFDRTVKLIGEEPFLKLQNSTVAVVGIGGVGSACCEALCRGGVGKLIILDHDTVSKTNLNRQIVATVDNIG